VVIDYGPGNSFSGFPTTYDGAQVRYFYFTPQTTATVTFTTSLLSGATSATLNSNWLLSTGPWQVTFSNGDVRYVTFTLGNTTATWTGGLSSNATASATYLNQGQHEGNTEFIRSAWNPGVFLSNDANYPAPGSGTRTALDNRRCQLSFGNDGSEYWKIGQGTLAGASLTTEVLSNFALQKVQQSGDTLGAYVPYLVERKTGNTSFGSGTNVPPAAYYFWNVSAGFNAALFENSWNADCTILLRQSGGSGNDVSIANVSGNMVLGNPALGPAVTIDKTTRRVIISQSLELTEFAVTYAALMVLDGTVGNTQIITPTNGVAFQINMNPSTSFAGTRVAIVIKNTTGGALGALTFGATIKASAWTQPANGFSRTITLRFDGTNWIEMSRTPADVPN
jgi:hypothetical protein